MRKREGSGQMGMLTLTAPSDGEHLRWVPGGRAHAPCGCERHAAGGLGRWNASASSRWNRLRTALKRAHPDLVFLRAVEVQKRGALHLHVILWVPGGFDVPATQHLALSAGFGCVIDWAPCEPGSRRAAYYVSKYVTKATDQRDDCPWEVEEVRRDEDGYTTGELHPRNVPARYRTWSSSRDWGLTMRDIRRVLQRAAEARARQGRADLDAGSTADGGGGADPLGGGAPRGSDPPPPA